MNANLREPRQLAAFPEAATRLVGSVWASTIVAALIVVLVVAGARAGFPSGWQVFVHTTGVLVSVLMLFLLQHTTNRETKAILIKLDELIQSSAEARDEMIGLEKAQLDDQEKVQESLHRERDT